MNATRMSRIVVILLGLGLSVGMAGQATAQTPAPAASKKLSRNDVDRMLGEARAAIEAGDFAKADQVITETEAANIRYPLFHFGDTPSSLRRELMRAQSSASNERGVGGILKRTLGRGDQPVEDPFLAPGPAAPEPTRLIDPQVMVDPEVKSASVGSPYGNFRDEVPGALPELTSADAQSLPALSEPPSRYPTATIDEIAQPAASRYAEPDSNSRYADPASMMEVPLDQLQTSTTQQAPAAVSELRFAQVPTTQLPEALPARSPQDLVAEGEQALKDRDRELALELFRRANADRSALDASTRQRLDDHLRMLTAAPETIQAPPTASPAAPEPESNFADADGEQQVLARQLSADVGRIQSESRQMREKDPKESLRMLEEMQAKVNKSSLNEDFKRRLQRRLQMVIDETEQYLQEHRADLELDERNKEVLAEIDRRQQLKLEMQSKIAEMVDEFNKLADDQRFYEAEQVALRLQELAPEEEVVGQVVLMSNFLRRQFINQDLSQRKENSYWNAMNDVNQSSVHTTGDGSEMTYNPKHWEDYVSKRGAGGDLNRHRSPAEMEIEQSLRKPVLMRYQNEPLAAVIDDLSKATGVNMVLDLRGLNQEGVSSDTRVSLNVNNEISLKSALNLILEPLHLSYVIKDEVLKITSEQLKDGEIFTHVYDVADLVVPIPNFVPDNNIGLQGLINSAHAAMGYGAGSFGHGPMSFINASAGDQSDGQVPPTALAQPGTAQGGAGFATPTSLPIGGGPGGLGGAANADFDSLIDLIISTVASDTWVENGGPEAEIRPFPTNLSLVISQTQDVHEQIADLLDQLRRLQDLQVTIEVRFIRLNDSFFERIGVDFDFNIENNDPDAGELVPGQAYEGEFPSAVVGLIDGEFPNFTNDLDIPFRQNSFGLAVPQFGTPMTVSSFGFAILSDIEAYFLIEASQGDSRSNVLNAPKVTLFNGQQAFVSDTSQTPFVISVVPVVGEFAAAQQPVIVVLSEGTLMTIQAVVSEDRRYVRLTVVPFFSEIGDVQEFTFEGTTSTSTSSSTTDDDDDGNNESDSDSDTVIRSGTTVQLPTFQFISVTTTVSVPDGGTVLLGGIKRLNENRNEFGVPLLSKVPYINRLFRNVGIGRETDSLMMMVTPRIIIQEEEEARLLGTPIP